VVKQSNGVSLLLITGTMGSGKSTVMAEVSDLLALRKLEHAAIDVDTLGVAWLSSSKNDDVMDANLECVCRNYASLGVRRFLVARALESPAELERCRRATLAENVAVCRLTANLATLQQRVKQREPGVLQAEFVARVETLDASLNRAALEDFTIANEERSITDVAREMLLRAGWVDK
jgi:predicted kinase